MIIAQLCEVYFCFMSQLLFSIALNVLLCLCRLRCDVERTFACSIVCRQAAAAPGRHLRSAGLLTEWAQLTSSVGKFIKVISL